MNTLPFEFAKRFNVIVCQENTITKIIYCGQLNSVTFSEIQRVFKTKLSLEKVDENRFNQLLIKHYQTDTKAAMQVIDDLNENQNLTKLIQELPKAEDLLAKQNEAPIIQLLNALLSEAIKLGASDCHIETYEEKVVVRLRIDGILQEIISQQRMIAPLIISRIKILAKLDISEKRLPQDGRISLCIAGRTVDVRVATLPTCHGERVVLRLLDKQNRRLDLSQLGMQTDALQAMQKLIAAPHGIILVTGPTGSGKTTTLYAALSALNQKTRNIMTIEDPIEYELPGISQTQVNAKIDMGFAKGLRAILRQDPDVVMIGEIRDSETAQIAIQASLTGHLVLSTLHTNHAVGAITRLIDLGVAPFLLSSTLLGVLAQRLIRLLCPHCKQGRPDNQSNMIFYPVGCETCHQTGYLGRTGVYEFFVMDETTRTLVNNASSEQKIKEYRSNLFPSMRQEAMRYVMLELTTLEEIARVISEDKA